MAVGGGGVETDVLFVKTAQVSLYFAKCSYSWHAAFIERQGSRANTVRILFVVSDEWIDCTSK